MCPRHKPLFASCEVCNERHRLPVGASLLIRMHEVTGMSIRDLRDLMGDRRTKYRLSDAQGRPKAEERNEPKESTYAH